MAAYRFLDNEEVSWDDVMAAHWDASQKRMAQHSVVLCIQDTTELDYRLGARAHPPSASRLSLDFSLGRRRCS